MLDEPTSEPRPVGSGRIIALLRDIQQERGVAYLFISHDLSTVRRIADRVAVMYLGRIVEMADTETIFESPSHPYTKALLSAVPDHGPSGGPHAGSCSRGDPQPSRCSSRAAPSRTGARWSTTGVASRPHGSRSFELATTSNASP